MYWSLFVIVVSLGAGIHAISPSISNGRWIDTWAAMPQLTEPANLPPPPYNATNVVFKGATIRQTLHMSVGASQIRIHVSNAFGTVELPITSMTVALSTPGSSTIQAGTLQAVTFSGSSSVVIPNGSLAVSDPLNFVIQAQSTVAVSIYLQDGQKSNYITSHPGSRTTSWFTTGNQVSAATLTGSTASAEHWYFISAVQAWVDPQSKTFSVIGDSITDGRGGTSNANNRWPDLLLARMLANSSTASIALVNQAAGGNRILADGLGPNAQGRIERDVLSHTGVGYAMIFEGVNDIGTAATDSTTQTALYTRLIQAYSQIITRVHSFGIPIFAATITPFSAPSVAQQPYSDPTREATRQKVNDWIRNSGKFDAVIEFDKLLADPSNPSQLNPAYNSGDYLHPNVAGYQRLADNFPLDLFIRFAGGVSSFV